MGHDNIASDHIDIRGSFTSAVSVSHRSRKTDKRSLAESGLEVSVQEPWNISQNER